MSAGRVQAERLGHHLTLQLAAWSGQFWRLAHPARPGLAPSTIPPFLPTLVPADGVMPPSAPSPPTLGWGNLANLDSGLGSGPQMPRLGPAASLLPARIPQAVPAALGQCGVKTL